MKAILMRLFNHEVLNREQARNLLQGITEGKYNEIQIASLLTAFQMRGINTEELIGFREALLNTRIPIDLEQFNPIDIVGTGGDGKNTFNISTLSCFVVAGAGYKVAKHGNYGATSISGASTVLENFGVKFSSEQAQLEKSIEKSGVAYLHAPLFNPAMKSVAGVRKALAVRTIFNLLGPLVNPAKPNYQLLGVADLSQMRIYTNVFQSLGLNFAVVTSLDGYDEISLTDKFKVATSGYERIYSPEELGFKTIKQSDLHAGETAEDAAKIFISVLENKASEAQKNSVIANSALAISIKENDKNLLDCIAQAKESLESGKALEAFNKYLEVNR